MTETNVGKVKKGKVGYKAVPKKWPAIGGLENFSFRIRIETPINGNNRDSELCLHFAEPSRRTRITCQASGPSHRKDTI